MADEHRHGTGRAVRTAGRAAPRSADCRRPQPLEIPKASTSASRRVRARLARRMTAQRSAVNPVLEPLVAVHKEMLPEGRPGAAAARLRGGRAAARRPDAPLRRPVHHPSAGGRQHPGRARHGHHHAGRRAAARHRRGHRLHAGGADRRVRRGGRPSRRRRHQAGQGGAGHRRRGRDHPQDDHRDGPRPAGAGDQGRRPAAQHAHDALPAAGEAGPQGPRDAGSHCAAGTSAGHGDGQVGAGGPVVRDPAPEEVRGDRAAGRRPGAVARHLPGQGARRDQRDAQRVEDQRRRGGQAQALLVDLPEDDRQGPRLRRHPRPGRRADPVRRDPRLLCRCGRGAFAVAADGGPVQGLHRPAAVRGVPVAAHHRRRARGQAAGGADPHQRHAQHRRVRHRRALALQGSQGPQRRSDRPRRRRDRRHGLDAAAARLAAGGRRSRRVPRVAALRPCGARDLRVHPEGRRGHAADRVDAGGLRLRGAHRGRPPLHRRAGQRPAGRAGAQARKRGSRSRFSRPRRPTPGRRGTGRRSWCRRARRPRSGSGSPRSAARRRWNPARTRSPARCAAADFRCSA